MNRNSNTWSLVAAILCALSLVPGHGWEELLDYIREIVAGPCGERVG